MSGFSQKHCPQCCRGYPADGPMLHHPGCTYEELLGDKLYTSSLPTAALRNMKPKTPAKPARGQRTWADVLRDRQRAIGEVR